MVTWTTCYSQAFQDLRTYMEDSLQQGLDMAGVDDVEFGQSEMAARKSALKQQNKQWIR